MVGCEWLGCEPVGVDLTAQTPTPTGGHGLRLGIRIRILVATLFSPARVGFLLRGGF